VTLIKSDNRVLKLNVGFLLKENAGYSRDFHFDEDYISVTQDVSVSYLKGSLHLTRTPQGILAQGILGAGMPAECTRCLASFILAFQIEFSDLFLYPRPANSTDPYFVHETGIIDLTPILREEGILAIPIQALCRPDCKGLCSHCGQDLNVAGCDCRTEQVDPRLAGLRALLDQS
jgi:uncharacterized protein